MPNVRISDLPFAALPLVGADSFFEVQTIEGGEQVSRRVAADNITVASAGSFIGTGIVDPSTALPYDYDAELVFENANGLETGRLGWDGASTLKLESLAFGANLQLVTRSPAGVEQVAFVYSSSNDVTQIGQNAIHIDGNGDIDFEYDILGGNTGNLMILRQFDLQLIDQATSTSGRLVFSQGSFIITERGHIGLDADGFFRMYTPLSAGPAIGARTSSVDWDPFDVNVSAGDAQLNEITGGVQSVSLTTITTGIAVHGVLTNNPATPGLAQDALVTLRNGTPTQVGVMGYIGADFRVEAQQRGAIMLLRVIDDAGLSINTFFADPNVNTQLGHGPSNAFVARTITPAAGGLQVDNQSTGAGFERVLTTADLAAAGVASFEGRVGAVVANVADYADVLTVFSVLQTFGAHAAFLDADEARFGTGNDVQLVFNATDMLFNAVDGVDFRFVGGTAGAETMLTLLANAGMEASFDGTVRFATTAIGAEVTGTGLDLVNSAASSTEFKVFNSAGGITFFASVTTGDGAIAQLSGAGVIQDRFMNFFLNGAVEQFFNATRRSATTSVGIDFFGQAVDLDNSSAGTVAVFLSRNNTGGMHIGVDASGNMNIRQLASSGSNEDIIAQATRNADIAFFHNNVETSRTDSLANGGFFVNNTLTGAGFERVLTTSDIGGSGGLITTAFKTTSETITNDAALSDDADLLVAVVANERYSLEMFFDFSSSNLGDFQFDLRGPAGFNLDGLVVMGIEDTILQLTSASSLTIDTTNPAFVYHASISAKVFATASGNVRFRWAQGTSDAGNTTLLIGSWIRIQRLS
jgi:hypothetical protein